MTLGKCRPQQQFTTTIPAVLLVLLAPSRLLTTHLPVRNNHRWRRTELPWPLTGRPAAAADRRLVLRRGGRPRADRPPGWEWRFIRAGLRGLSALVSVCMHLDSFDRFPCRYLLSRLQTLISDSSICSSSCSSPQQLFYAAPSTHTLPARMQRCRLPLHALHHINADCMHAVSPTTSTRLRPTRT